MDLARALGSAGLAGIGETETRDFANALEPCSFQAGEVLIREGATDDSLYILTSGRARVEAQGKLLNHLGPGETAGELALLTGDPRSATVIAVEPTVCAKLSRPEFERLSRVHPEAAERMREKMRRRLRKVRLAFSLHLSNLFGDLDAEVVRDLEAELQMTTLRSGEILYRQGEPGDTLAVVVNGKLRVLARRESGEESAVAELGRGETVGEMAVVSGEARTATVMAIRDSNLAVLSREAFDRLLSKHPRAMTRMVADKLVTRLRNMTSGAAKPGKTVATLALLPVHDGLDLSAFAQALAKSLAPFGATLLLSSGVVDRALLREGAAQVEESDPRHLTMVEWLNRKELEHDFVLYQMDAGASAWSARCLRQADQVILVGNGGGDPAVCELERRILPSQQQILALIQNDRTPSGTLAWLLPRSVERHHHVRLGESGDFDRMARFLTGRAVGIALGGGFARGLAHLGVLRAMADLGIPVDAFGGTSMGAMIGALWTQGWEYEKIVAETCAGCQDSFNDLTFPFVAFKQGKKFSDLMKSFYGERQIEDLFYPFFCVSANLNRAEVKVHTRGALAKAVLASTRAPAVFPPVVYDGELHVDGGVLNNVPVDIMKPFCNGGTVIGVDVSPPHELNLIADYGDGVSGWQAFKNRFSPFVKANTYVPSILLIVMRTVEFGGISFKRRASEAADIYLRPPLLRFKRTDFHAAAEIAQVGYQHAREQIEAWRNSRVKP
jgi:NTE family protein